MKVSHYVIAFIVLVVLLTLYKNNKENPVKEEVIEQKVEPEQNTEQAQTPIDSLATKRADNSVYVFGNLKEHLTKEKIDGSIVITQNNKEYREIRSNVEGKFELYLPLDHTYNIKFKKNNFVSKNIDVDARNIPENVRRGGFSMKLDVDLFESIPDLDFSILDDPMGKAKWDPNKGIINWNYDHINSIKSEIDSLMIMVDQKG